MIDWIKTKEIYGRTTLSGDKPMVVVKCDTCQVDSNIAIRRKDKVVDNQYPWQCRKCGGRRPEVRAKLSKSTTNQWANSEYRIDREMSSKKLWDNPNYIERHSLTVSTESSRLKCARAAVIGRQMHCQYINDPYDMALDHTAVITAMQRVYTTSDARALLNDYWSRENTNNELPATGFCYIAAEAAFYILGGVKAGLKPMCASYGDHETHWWLVNECGHIIDPTSAQYGNDSPPYHLGRGIGFQNGHSEPSKRAQILISLTLNELGIAPPTKHI